MDKNACFRNIPKVDVLLEDPAIVALCEEFGRDITVDCIRSCTDELRAFIGKSDDMDAIVRRTDSLVRDICNAAEKLFTPDLRPVINGTGTVLHTNLGRAPISKEHSERMQALVSGYSNLEYDLDAGKRGERYSHFEKLLCRITGAEAAMAVNNNAAAVFLVLSALGVGKEIPVSRGELVEIGGKFRVPDVMAQSGAIMVEVGTTNKTHPSDYENVINENTGALLKVHTSNFRIVGFTESVDIKELCEIGAKHDLPVIEDIGSGVLIDLSKYGLPYEPTVQESLRAGASIVCFSGDKLLGGPQAGIIVGKKEYIAKIKKHPMTRALRIDKFTAGALELTFEEYLSEERAVKNIPVLRMLTRSAYDIAESADRLAALLKGLDADIAVEECESQVGGGSMPLARLASRAVTIKPRSISTAAFEERLRKLPMPIVGRVYDDRVALDVRTIDDELFDAVAEGVMKALE